MNPESTKAPARPASAGYAYGEHPTREGERRYYACSLIKYHVADQRHFAKKVDAIRWAREALTTPLVSVVRVTREVQGWYLDFAVTGEELMVWQDDGLVFEAKRVVTRSEVEVVEA